MDPVSLILFAGLLFAAREGYRGLREHHGGTPRPPGRKVTRQDAGRWGRELIYGFPHFRAGWTEGWQAHAASAEPARHANRATRADQLEARARYRRERIAQLERIRAAKTQIRHIGAGGGQAGPAGPAPAPGRVPAPTAGAGAAEPVTFREPLGPPAGVPGEPDPGGPGPRIGRDADGQLARAMPGLEDAARQYRAGPPPPDPAEQLPPYVPPPMPDAAVPRDGERRGRRRQAPR